VKVTRIFVDCEFIEDGKTIDLISLGAVTEDGRYFYAVSSDFDESKANQWVRDNVLTRLEPSETWVPRAVIAAKFQAWVDQFLPVEFWGYYADYDWVAICQLYGPMIALPKGWPMYCADIEQWAIALSAPVDILPQPAGPEEHHALKDALWNKTSWETLAEFARTLVPL
jgi:hypothetical protein